MKYSIPVKTKHTQKFPLSCCALAQIACDSNATKEEVQFQIDRLKDESKCRWKPDDRRSGEQAAFVITTPSEKGLEKILAELEFKPIVKFNRRNGYPQTGKLTMWFLTWE